MTKIGEVMKEVFMRHEGLRTLREIHAEMVAQASKRKLSLEGMQSATAFLRKIGATLPEGMSKASTHALAIQDEIIVILEELEVQQRAAADKVQVIIDRESEALKYVDVER